MPNWKPRSPDTFPWLFSQTVKAAAADIDKPIILRNDFNSKAEAKLYVNTFRYWRYCLREWAGGEYGNASAIERDFKLCTKIEWCPIVYTQWVVTVTARRRAVDLLPAGLVDYASI